MRVKAVLFDLGRTLIKTTYFPEIYKRILQVYGVRVSSEEVLKAHRDNEKELDVVKGQLRFGKDFWIKWNLRVLESIGIQQNRRLLAKKIDELWWEYADAEVYPDVMETLAQLKAKGVKVGVVTNGLKRDFEQILAKLELTNCFDVVIGIDTCNKGKPDKEIFLCALDKLHVRPQETVFVGDSLKYDYEGAKKAGLKPLLIDREGSSSENVETIRNLAGVLQHV
ncbi:MAG: HAD-IA family hydrolase [Candidatus Bathyarchaeota archaeon]|nr:MAG: HAD-IA family hydrolase [Candidatus Bathyarchaeota archaeon]